MERQVDRGHQRLEQESMIQNDLHLQLSKPAANPPPQNIKKRRKTAKKARIPYIGFR
jgi:hypothetical protein